ncbi:MAG: MBOAT family protein [Gemmatimonadaceae bacterium]|nr:MBOAT family protein [Gemmatimonadaceae bacterium]
MIFNSLEYFVFLPIVVGMYFALPLVPRRLALLAASLYFYMYWKPEYVVIILVSCAIDWYAALRIAATAEPRVRKRWLIASISTNLLILGTFKYYNFFVDSLQQVGIGESLPASDLILPLGISFYTFQAMSFTIDVYRGKLEAPKSYLRVLLCVTFFPHLVAGPIVRASDLLPQFEVKQRFDWDNLTYGCQRILNGFVKKSVIADNLAPWTDAVFSHPERYSSVGLVLATYAYAARIYCDFSGYSDIAIGSARLMGIRFTENFEAPYLSASIQEFWRRWHISLSTWLREYLYISLGGNRGAPWKTYRNLLLTMMLGGLWHGASFNFVIWGTLHGLWLATERFYNERFGGPPRPPSEGLSARLGRALKIVLVFHGVCLTWIFFVSRDLATSTEVLSRIATFAPGNLVATSDWIKTLLAFALACTYFIGVRFANRGPAWRWWLTGVFGILLVILFGTSSHEFIYFIF